MSEKNVKTIFCDIDGTILRQVDFNELNENNFEVLPGAREKFREWLAAEETAICTQRTWMSALNHTRGIKVI